MASVYGRFIIEPRGSILHSSTNHCNAVTLPSSVLSGGLRYCAHVAWLMLSSGADVVDCVSSWDELGWNRLLSGLKAKRSSSREIFSIPSS